MIERKQATEERKGRKRQTDGEKEINRKIDVQTNKKTVFSPSLWTIRAMFDSFPPQNQSKTALLQQTLHTLFSRNVTQEEILKC